MLCLQQKLVTIIFEQNYTARFQEIFSNQGLFTKMRPYCKMFPTISHFLSWSDCIVYGHSKCSHCIFTAQGDKKISDLKTAEFTELIIDLVPRLSQVSNAPVTSHPRAPYGLFMGCFEQKSYVHSRGPYGTRAVPYEDCLLVWGPYRF